jgi:hypothetical protein
MEKESRSEMCSLRRSFLKRIWRSEEIGILWQMSISVVHRPREVFDHVVI